MQLCFIIQYKDDLEGELTPENVAKIIDQNLLTKFLQSPFEKIVACC